MKVHANLCLLFRSVEFLIERDVDWVGNTHSLVLTVPLRFLYTSVGVQFIVWRRCVESWSHVGAKVVVIWYVLWQLCFNNAQLVDLRETLKCNCNKFILWLHRLQAQWMFSFIILFYSWFSYNLVSIFGN